MVDHGSYFRKRPPRLRHVRRFRVFRSVQTPIGVGASQTNVLSAQRDLNIIKSVADLSSQCFAGYTMNDVLVLTFREFSSPAQRLPQPDRWNMSYCVVSHEFFDSAGVISLHAEFLKQGMNFLESG